MLFSMNRNKIGILTFHSTLNYGAHLQAYALCNYIRGLGFECEIVDYRNDRILASYDLRLSKNMSSPKTLLKYLLTVADMKRKKQALETFLRPYVSKETYVKDTIGKASESYHTIVVGSDQIWNLELTGNDKSYYLEFPVVKRVAYAASFGKKPTDIKEISSIENELRVFDYIAVREADAVGYLRGLGIEKAIQTIDPTFLLTKEQWQRLIAKAKRYHQKKKYILVYAQGRPRLGFKFAEEVARRENLELIVIHSYAKKYPNALNIRDASIEEFLMLINDAEHVVTTSFHGMALSLILGKDLYYEEKSNSDNANSRLKSLAELMHIENHKIEKSMPEKDMLPINYEYVGKVIEREREKAKEFLLKAFKD